MAFVNFLNKRLEFLQIFTRREKQIYILVVLVAIGLNLVVGKLRISADQRESQVLLSMEMNSLSQRLAATASALALNANFVTAFEQGNYAEVMHNLVTFKNSKIAEQIRIYDLQGKVVADVEHSGLFGGTGPETEIVLGQQKIGAGLSAFVPTASGTLFMNISSIESLNGPVGFLALGQDLNTSFISRLSQKHIFFDSVLFVRIDQAQQSSIQDVIVTADECDVLPHEWKIVAHSPQVTRVLTESVWALLLTLALLISSVPFWADLRRSQNALLEQQTRQIHSARLVALGEMCAGIAHEINSPLAIISGTSQQLRRSLDQLQLPEALVGKAQQLCARIESTVGRISKIITGMRTIARDSSQDPLEKASLKVILTDTLELAREKLIHNQIELRLNLALAEDCVMCRPVQLSQVFLNLIGNAADAIETLPERWLSIEMAQKGHEILVTFTDSGPGISEALRNRIMEPFFTTKPVGVGTGLGLSIARGVLQAHNGGLAVDASRPNTCFVVRLPRLEDQAEVPVNSGCQIQS